MSSLVQNIYWCGCYRIPICSLLKRFHDYMIMDTLQVPSLLIWWRHQMETFFALLALCEGNPPVTGGFPTQSRVTQSKQSRRYWFETPPPSLWRHCKAGLALSHCRACCWFSSCYRWYAISRHSADYRIYISTIHISTIKNEFSDFIFHFLFKMAEVISEDMGILDGLISIKISKRSYIGGNASTDTGQFNVWSTGGSGGHHKLKTQNCHDTNFVVTDGAGSVCPGQCWSYITPPKTILLPTHRDSRGIVNPRSDEER